MFRESPFPAVLVFFLAPLVAFAADVPDRPDPRIQITSPVAGSTFAPGDTVTVDVSVDSSIQPTYVAAGMYPTVLNFADKPPFRILLVVPDYFAGKTDISVMVLEGDDKEYLGPSIPILVRPAYPPARLLATDMLMLDEGSARSIVVHGIFANDTQIALSSSVVGTTYTSSEPWIASVDAEGSVTGISAGITVVKTEYGGISAFTVVFVEGEDPAPVRDVTGQVRIDVGELRPMERQFRFQQTITIGNTGTEPIPGPLLLTLDSVPSEVRWVNHGGVTENVPPRGSDYTSLDLASGIALAPGESASLVLEFDALDASEITFRPRITQSQWP